MDERPPPQPSRVHTTAITLRAEAILGLMSEANAQYARRAFVAA